MLTLTTVPGVVAADPPRVPGGAKRPVPARSVVVLQRTESTKRRAHPAPTRRTTYRIQFSSATTLPQGAELVPYLDALGVGAVYASPLLEAGAGSNHGYDVVDPTRISGERGGEEGRRALVAAVRARGMGFLLDIVPNHVGVDVAQANPWWWDVLTHGRASRYAHVLRHRLGRRDRCSVPILGADEEKVAPRAVARRATTASRAALLRARVPDRARHGLTGTAQEVHERQHYRLTSWKRGAAELTYRRFFDVSTLAAVRVEDPEVFAATHGEVLRWVEAGDVDGLRVDHPDGLSDPGGYARRLRAAIGPGRWLLVEKILGVGEELPVSWPVDGTSGYEALREICGVFVDADGAGLLTQLTAEHLGRRENAHAVEHAARREVTDTILAAEVRRIAALVPVAPTDDGPGPSAEEAVAELLCGFPVYRSYLPEGRSALETAVSVARAHRPDLAEVLATIRDTMLADPDGELATRVQQTSGMVMAKGVEDTAFYRYNRLVALNEVGGDPDRFGVSPAEFHDRNAGRVASWPRTMTTLSTHDTKRSEDVRARLAVLAEIPDEWAPRFRRWAAAHPLPDRSLDLLAWQNLVGAWPISAERLAAYLGKALAGGQARHQPRSIRTPRSTPRWRRGRSRCWATPGSWRRSRSSSHGSTSRAAATRWARSCCRSPGPGCRTSTRAPSSTSTRSWIRTTGARSTGSCAGSSSRASTAGGCRSSAEKDRTRRTSTRRARRSCWSRHRHCSCAGSDRSCSPGTGPSRPRGRRRSTRSRSPGRRSSWRWRPGCRSGSPPRGGWADTVLPLPDGAAAWTDVLTGTPVGSSAPRLAQVLARYPVALLVRLRTDASPSHRDPLDVAASGPAAAARPGRIAPWLSSRSGRR